jgi:predicted nucleotidyltransferase component of viral defense system
MDRNNPYFRQVALLVRALPDIAKQKCFALKGGTAINLFVRRLPRLSVDIDLVYLPLSGRDEALSEIRQALGHIERDLKARIPGLGIQATNPKTTDSQRLTLRHGGSQIKIELSPVLRGTVWPVRDLAVCSEVEETFGFAEMPVVSFNDLYAGKICAALDRQHPRDLFDIKLLLENEGIDRDLLKTFLVYLISHGRPMSELLSPARKDIRAVYEAEFKDMTSEPVALDDLLEARETLVKTLRSALTDDDRKFLLSMKSREPDWSLLDLKGVEALPAVRWKLQNLGKMNAAKHEEAFGQLAKVLEAARW